MIGSSGHCAAGGICPAHREPTTRGRSASSPGLGPRVRQITSWAGARLETRSVAIRIALSRRPGASGRGRASPGDRMAPIHRGRPRRFRRRLRGAARQAWFPHREGVTSQLLDSNRAFLNPSRKLKDYAAPQPTRQGLRSAIRSRIDLRSSERQIPCAPATCVDQSASKFASSTAISMHEPICSRR